MYGNTIRSIHNCNNCVYNLLRVAVSSEGGCELWTALNHKPCPYHTAYAFHCQVGTNWNTLFLSVFTPAPGHDKVVVELWMP